MDVKHVRSVTKLSIMDRRQLLVGGIGAALTTGVMAKTWAAMSQSFNATLSMPLPQPAQLTRGVFDVGPLGYVAEEYLLSMAADMTPAMIMMDRPTTPGQQPGAPFLSPGAPPVLGKTPACTRLVIYRPIHVRQYSGVTIVEPIHPGVRQPVVFAAINRFYANHGHIAVTIEHPGGFAALKAANPQRYAALHVDDYTQFYDLLAAAAELARFGHPQLATGKARHVYLTGFSATGMMTAAFARHHHARASAQIRHAIFDGYAPHGNGVPTPDLDVPIMRVNTQSEFLGIGAELGSRAADSDARHSRRRRYEVAGAPHSGFETYFPGAAIPPGGVPEISTAVTPMCAALFPPNTQRNAMPVAPVFAAVLHNMEAWVRRGTLPPSAPWLEVLDGRVRTDDQGNALGGLRMPPILVPAARYGVGQRGDNACELVGFTEAFTPETMRRLYDTPERYLQLYDQAIQQLTSTRLILPESTERLQIFARQFAGFK